MIRELLTTKQASKLSGATLRQLQWWDEKGMLIPKVKGTPGDPKNGNGRWYTGKQVETAKKLALLSKAGVQVRFAEKYLRKHWDKAIRITGPVIVHDTLVVPKKPSAVKWRQS